MRRTILLALLALTVLTGTALADSLDGRLGLTGKGGVLDPLQDDFVSSTSKSRAGLSGGGGLIFGFGRNFAAEVDVTHVPGLDVEMSGSKVFDATLTDVALGIQFRVTPENRLVPYFGAGVDFIKGSLKTLEGVEYDMDWTEGGHVSLGFDYFITRGITFTAELRAILAAKGDVTSAGLKVGDYNPNSFIGTVGIRLLLPQSSYW